jgi:Flp pilus assembly protein TadD
MRQAIDLGGDAGDALYILGCLQRDAGDLAAAGRTLLDAFTRSPERADIANALGRVLAAMRAFPIALRFLSRAAELAPRQNSYRLDLAETLIRAGDAAAARAICTALQPAARQRAELRDDLACVLLLLNDYDGIVRLYAGRGHGSSRSATAAKGVAAHALACRHFGRAAEARRLAAQALTIDPHSAEIHKLLGTLAHDAGDAAEARRHFEQAITLAPGDAQAHANLAAVLLMADNGDRAGWAEWEWRHAGGGNGDPRCAGIPAWDGAPLREGRLFVRAEQGIGDQILMLGYVAALADRGMSLAVETDPRLVPLLRRTLPGVLAVPQGDAPPDDVRAHCLLGSLPHLTGLPPQAPRLFADAARAVALRERYCAAGPAGTRLVGLSWASRNPEIGRFRSLSAVELAPLAALDGVTLVDLQYRSEPAGRAALSKGRATFVHDAEIDQGGDLDAFAAQIAALDLVVTIDNSTAHMAGALGVPTLILLPAGPGLMWYWMREDKRTGWYPSARLYRQERVGDWSGAVASVCRAIAE